MKLTILALAVDHVKDNVQLALLAKETLNLKLTQIHVLIADLAQVHVQLALLAKHKNLLEKAFKKMNAFFFFPFFLFLVATLHQSF